MKIVITPSRKLGQSQFQMWVGFVKVCLELVLNWNIDTMVRYVIAVVHLEWIVMANVY